MLDRESLSLLQEAVEILEQGFGALPEFTPEADREALRAVLSETARRMQDNYPYPHPLYAGQMLKPPHAVARLAYALTLWINPNNHALDGGRASSAMEREAVAEIAHMFGWETNLGHLCGGGTVANMEALWIAGEVTGKRTVVASSQAHYTHPRLCGVLGLPFEALPTDDRARMDLNALEDRLKRGDVGTVVATLGTTATGSCDPLPKILDLRERYGFRLHCDTAYGGYFTLADNLRPETRAAFDVLREADSIVVDPHKHGLQPYGCGCVLFRDPAVGRFYKHDSPYTYFSSAELHLGEISLECSRPGAAAVALWATQQLLPYVPGGKFATLLGDSRRAALDIHARIEAEERFLAAWEPELDIVLWTLNADSASEASRLNRLLFAEAAQNHLHLALANLPANLFRARWPLRWDQETITCLRSCLMKPEHLAWSDTLWETLSAATDHVMKTSG
jgi:tyrosine decarboxylase / aspartate 1-decarboxylase